MLFAYWVMKESICLFRADMTSFWCIKARVMSLSLDGPWVNRAIPQWEQCIFNDTFRDSSGMSLRSSTPLLHTLAEEMVLNNYLPSTVVTL